MKKYAILLNVLVLGFLLLATEACKNKKEEDPKPAESDVATKVSGKYTMTYISIDGEEYDLPYETQGGSTYTGTIKLSKATSKTIDGVFSLKIDGDVQSMNIENVTVKEAGTDRFEFFDGDDQVGLSLDGEIEFHLTNEAGKEYVIIGEK